MAFMQIRQLCEARGLNITELSRKAEIPYPSALALWHDDSKQFNRRTLVRVARALGVKVGDLFAPDADKDAIEA